MIETCRIEPESSSIPGSKLLSLQESFARLNSKLHDEIGRIDQQHTVLFLISTLSTNSLLTPRSTSDQGHETLKEELHTFKTGTEKTLLTFNENFLKFESNSNSNQEEKLSKLNTRLGQLEEQLLANQNQCVKQDQLTATTKHLKECDEILGQAAMSNRNVSAMFSGKRLSLLLI
jgi:hypothetical protein